MILPKPKIKYEIGEGCITTTFTMPPTPEPRIGPGMILERGRTRIILPDLWGDSDFEIRKARRRLLSGRWEWDTQRWGTMDVTSVRYLLLSGFKIIRPADEESRNAK